jgi:hypothetical protein
LIFDRSKHRERKETYIKSLEQQVLQLLDHQNTAAVEKRALEEENAMLRRLLEQNGIAIPGQAAGLGQPATVSVLDMPSGLQRLQVTMPESNLDYLAGFDTSFSSAPRDSSSPQSIDVEVSAHSDFDIPAARSGAPAVPPPAFQTRLPSESVQIHPPSTLQDLTGSTLPSVRQPIPHPDGLDAAQIGIDFVLALEYPCLEHTRPSPDAGGSSGHALTAQAPLLTHAPLPLQPASSWTIPAVEIERLLNLSSHLNLPGELTPVQAWARIRSYPGFEKLNLDQLEILKLALLKEIQCYGLVLLDWILQAC